MTKKERARVFNPSPFFSIYTVTYQIPFVSLPLIVQVYSRLMRPVARAVLMTLSNLNLSISLQTIPIKSHGFGEVLAPDPSRYCPKMSSVRGAGCGIEPHTQMNCPG